MHKSRSTKKVVERPIEIEKVQKATEPEILQLEKPAEKKFIMVRPIQRPPQKDFIKQLAV